MYNNSNQKIELNLSNLYTYFLKKNDAYQRSSSDAKRLAAGL